MYIVTANPRKYEPFDHGRRGSTGGEFLGDSDRTRGGGDGDVAIFGGDVIGDPFGDGRTEPVIQDRLDPLRRQDQ